MLHIWDMAGTPPGNNLPITGVSSISKKKGEDRWCVCYLPIKIRKWENGIYILNKI